MNFLLVLFVFPESLSASRRAMNRKGKNRIVGEDEMTISSELSNYLVSISISPIVTAVKPFVVAFPCGSSRAFFHLSANSCQPMFQWLAQSEIPTRLLLAKTGV